MEHKITTDLQVECPTFKLSDLWFAQSFETTHFVRRNDCMLRKLTLTILCLRSSRYTYTRLPAFAVAFFFGSISISNLVHAPNDLRHTHQNAHYARSHIKQQQQNWQHDTIEWFNSFYFQITCFGCRLCTIYKKQNRVHLITPKAICTVSLISFVCEWARRQKLDVNSIFIFLSNHSLSRRHTN